MASFPIPGDAVLASNGRTLLMTTGSKRVAQRLRVGIRTVLGTYKYDLTKGIPWFQLLEKPNQVLLRAAIRDYFLSHPEVHSILSLQFINDRASRRMSVAYSLRMADGETVTATTTITPLA